MKALDFVACSMKLYEKQMEPICREYGLTAMELNILLFLANNPEYDTAKEIVERRYLTKSHVSISIRSLEERHLLRKESRNGDHRTTHLVLQPESNEIISRGQSAQSAYLEMLMAGLSETEIRNFQMYLDKIGENAIKGMKEA
ncbi:MAG TPA: helix-turn-helix domain-containing protein [Clostridia bacterium]|jgi:MarR family transcriptional regulator for hemolysin|nr:helix-turn-helix domain-containing protein [Clostridia bacterium]HUM61129.1 helix-turn-helix domain-containing protein [Clostridia bacterium]